MFFRKKEMKYKEWLIDNIYYYIELDYYNSEKILETFKKFVNEKYFNYFAVEIALNRHRITDNRTYDFVACDVFESKHCADIDRRFEHCCEQIFTKKEIKNIVFKE